MTKRGKPDASVRRDPSAPSSVDGKGGAQSKTGEPTCAPIKPMPKIFAALMIGFAIWLGLLFTLYFKTVYPLRYPSTDATTRPGASALPSAPR